MTQEKWTVLLRGFQALTALYAVVAIGFMVMLVTGCAGAPLTIEIDPTTDKVVKFELDPTVGGTGCVWYSVSYDDKNRIVFDVLIDQAGSSDWGGFRLVDSAFGTVGSIFGGTTGQKEGMREAKATSACASLTVTNPPDTFIRVPEGVDPATLEAFIEALTGGE